MKKITTLFFFIVFFMLSIPKEKINPVFEEINYLEAISQNHFCYITVKDKQVTTQNFMHYFKDFHILSIQPYINEIYKEKVENEIGNYIFSSDTIENNLIYFTKHYQKTLKQFGFLSDYAKTEVYGITIKQVKMLCEENISKKLDGLKYNVNVRNK